MPKVVLTFVASLALSLVLASPRAVACEASCGAPFTCSCSAGPCPSGTVESCSSICLASFGCACSCIAVSGTGSPPSSPKNPRLGMQESWTYHLGGNVSLISFGTVLHEVTGWGVVIVGSGAVTVHGGTWSDSLEDVVADIGAADGFTASWNDTAGVVTLTVN